MPDHRDNLLIALDRWASGQHENFLTEAFVDVLNRLSSSSPELFGQLLKRITDGEFNPAVEELAGFNVVSQLSTDQGSPDIAITGPDHYALIEVKDQSPVDPDQLNRYSRLIELNTAGNKCLVLLTRDQTPPLDIKWLQKPIRWYQVLEWIGDIKDKHKLDDVSGYVIRPTQAGFESFVKTYPPFRDNWRTAFWSKVASLFESVDRSFRLGSATEALTRVSFPSNADEALYWDPLLDVMARHRYSGFYWDRWNPSPDAQWRKYITADRTPYPLWGLDRLDIEICPTSKYDAPGSNC